MAALQNTPKALKTQCDTLWYCVDVPNRENQRAARDSHYSHSEALSVCETFLAALI